MFPGGGADRYGRGGPSEGRLSCQPPRVYGGVARPGLSTLACPCPRSCGTRVSVWPVVSGWAGVVPAGSQVSGVVVQIRGGSVILGPLTGQLACSAVLTHAPVGAVARARRGPLEGPLHNKLALLLALVWRDYVRKSLTTSRDGRI